MVTCLPLIVRVACSYSKVGNLEIDPIFEMSDNASFSYWTIQPFKLFLCTKMTKLAQLHPCAVALIRPTKFDPEILGA